MEAPALGREVHVSAAPSACILHLDADAFFASLEQRDDPSLRGRPVAVGTGVVASCSYEARRWGVRTGMRLTEARQRCRPLRVLPGDYRRYEQAARRMLAICLEHTPRVEVAALDDLYLDLTGSRDRSGEPTARTLHAQIRHEVGLSTSLGVGTSKLIAAVATQQAKERTDRTSPQTAVVCVPPGAEERYLAPWPVEILPGVGPKFLARLQRLNVHCVGEVAGMPLAVLCGLFGDRGRKLRDLARGIDPRSVEPTRPPQSVSRRTSFDPPTSDEEFLRAMLDHLLERAVSWLRFSNLAARGLTLSLCYGDYKPADGRASFRPATQDEAPLKAAARERLGRLYNRRLPLRLLGIELSPLQPVEGQQSLFPDPEAQRRRRLAECKDAVRQRFGFLALTTGTSLLLAQQLEHDRDNFRLRTPCLTR
jgi:DNA polymerase-4